MEISYDFPHCTFKNLNRLFDKISCLKFALPTLKTLIRSAEKDKNKIVHANPIVCFLSFFNLAWKRGTLNWLRSRWFLCAGKTSVGHFIIQSYQRNWKGLRIYGSKGPYCPLWWIDVCLGVGTSAFLQPGSLEKKFFFCVCHYMELCLLTSLPQQQHTGSWHLRAERVNRWTDMEHHLWIRHCGRC